MVETVTVGANRTHPIGEGRPRRHIRYNVDGGLPEPTVVAQRNGRAIALRTRSEYEYDAYNRIEAERKTMRYYFNDEWFDEGYINSVFGDNSRATRINTSNQPFRCKNCKKHFRRIHKSIEILYMKNFQTTFLMECEWEKVSVEHVMKCPLCNSVVKKRI